MWKHQHLCRILLVASEPVAYRLVQLCACDSVHITAAILFCWPVIDVYLTWSYDNWITDKKLAILMKRSYKKPTSMNLTISYEECSKVWSMVKLTRKPCYRKDDRAMRPIAYKGALKIIGSPCMATPTANFPDIFNGLLFRSIPPVTVRTKFEVRTFTRFWDRPNSDWLEFWVGVAEI